MMTCRGNFTEQGFQLRRRAPNFCSSECAGPVSTHKSHIRSVCHFLIAK